jgi:hypothetical protein
MLNLDNVSQHNRWKDKKRKSKYNQKQKQNTNIKINMAGGKGGSKAPQFVPQ